MKIMSHLRLVLWIMALLSIPADFFVGKDHRWYWLIPVDAVFGTLGTFLLILLIRILALIAGQREEFYD